MLPASLSRELLTGVLREELGFNGLITTDATIMGGYCQAMERRRAIPTSIAAGCDMLVFSTDIYEDLGYMREGLENGLLSRERLDEAVTHVLALKAVAQRPKHIHEIRAAEWQADCARKAGPARGAVRAALGRAAWHGEAAAQAPDAGRSEPADGEQPDDSADKLEPQARVG